MSIHPERIEVSTERSLPPIFVRKLGPVGTIAKAEKERKDETAKIQGKMRFSLRACAKRAGFMRVGGDRERAESQQWLAILCNFKLIKEKSG
jgi:hypothetical protein